ncbi:lytic polysaccharide monooxygenase auxiliary activity family 9 protein [Streptomyces murinus]|uniref:lytic polysaccharide monooxygenase auxiliary activity family 9 protein n=1 Tax=Streptomyces murinus TaxID=33900 RepID=UPI002378518E|nr:lytic polysaccharide monooxygenase auxiliary activity family 9 protein [Streptomyces murinus]
MRPEVFLRPGSEVRHGYSEFPTSRSRWCQMDKSLKCGPIANEPQSVEGPKGFPVGGPRDGELASANNERFGELDDILAPNGKPWPVTPVVGGRVYRFQWWLTAPHSTAKFHYYLTRPDWNQSARLTRSQLDLEPWLTVKFQSGEIPDNAVAHWARIPSGRRGRHVLYAVWDIADTVNAFYSACDVNFG